MGKKRALSDDQRNRRPQRGGKYIGMSKVLAIAQFTLYEALRTRLIWMVLAILAALVLGSAFIAQVAITETVRLQTGFIAATGRMAAVFVVCLHVASSMTREFNDKGTELLLSLDLPRSSYYVGKLLGFSAVALGVALATTLALAWLTPHAGLVVWGLSLGCELVVITAVTLFCVITFVQIMPAVSFVFAFYLLARSIAAIQLISGSQLLSPYGWTHKVTSFLVQALALVLPDLSRFTQTTWLVNGADSAMSLGWIGTQTVVYGGLLTAAGLFDLYRKNL
jgi:ABC-type transport system involved in multi-copper enzyme maturation permease subunit